MTKRQELETVCSRMRAMGYRNVRIDGKQVKAAGLLPCRSVVVRLSPEDEIPECGLTCNCPHEARERARMARQEG